ncbi:MAG: DEAD/DEAH box helicase [Bdellovibrio sp.]
MKFQVSTAKSINKFEDMPLASVLYSALKKMSIKKPTSIQGQAIPLVLDGRDVIGVAETGSGKTLAYALSVLTILERRPEARALILAPSREMAQQIHKVCTELCIELPVSTCLAIGGANGDRQAAELKKLPKLIIATPGRLMDHLSTNKLLLKGVEFVIVDEADRMLDMGFNPQLQAIQSTLRGPRQTLMFSASFGGSVESIAELFLRPDALMVRTESAEAPVLSLNQRVLFLDRSMKNDRLLDELNAAKGGVILFTGSQDSCETVGKYLKEYGYSTDYIHGGHSQGQRNRVVREFREGTIRIMVTTDLLARGLDVPHVDHVINFELPFQAEDFLHRIGRTARAGRSGRAVTFITPSDFRMYQKIKEYLADAEEIKLDPRFQFIQRSRRADHEARAKAPGSRARKDGKHNNKAKGQVVVDGKSLLTPFRLKNGKSGIKGKQGAKRK